MKIANIFIFISGFAATQVSLLAKNNTATCVMYDECGPLDSGWFSKNLNCPDNKPARKVKYLLV
jgi:hypothetical protein